MGREAVVGSVHLDTIDPGPPAGRVSPETGTPKGVAGPGQ